VSALTAKLGRLLFRSPKICSDSFALNRSGFFNLYQGALRNAHLGLAALRSAVSSSPFEGQVRTLKRDGVLIIPDFLKAADFEYARGVFETQEGHFEVQIPRAPLTRTFLVTRYQYPQITVMDPKAMAPFTQNPLFETLLKRVTGIGSHLPPLVYFMEQSFAKPDLGQPHSDYQDKLHYDVTYPSLKAILYLEDTDKTNGAFRIAKGSHLPSWRRWRGEYQFACDRTTPTRAKSDHPSVDPALFDLSRLTSIEGKKNTLIVFDTRCVHARGDFSSDKPRHTVFIDFRSGLSAANFLPGALRPTIKEFSNANAAR
jgi:hypothetical protein